MSLRLKAFSSPATSEGSNTLSPAGLRKDLDPQQPTRSRYDVCEMSGLADVHVYKALKSRQELPKQAGRKPARSRLLWLLEKRLALLTTTSHPLSTATCIRR